MLEFAVTVYFFTASAAVICACVFVMWRIRKDRA